MNKEPLHRQRIRRLPKEGWSWVDRRFLREEAASVSREAVFLYFFLCAVSDKEGLSYYSVTSIAARLRLAEPAVVRAREELEARDLIAYNSPLYQVLSLPDRSARERRSSSEPGLIGDLMRELATRGREKLSEPEEPPERK